MCLNSCKNGCVFFVASDLSLTATDKLSDSGAGLVYQCARGLVPARHLFYTATATIQYNGQLMLATEVFSPVLVWPGHSMNTIKTPFLWQKTVTVQTTSTSTHVTADLQEPMSILLIARQNHEVSQCSWPRSCYLNNIWLAGTQADWPCAEKNSYSKHAPQ